MSLGRTITKNITANYFGVAGQIVIAFFLSPFLVKTLGDTQYGIWTVVAALSGYMSLLDLGIASALTRFVSKYHATGEHEKVKKILSSALFIFVLISVLLISVSPYLADLMVQSMSFKPSFKGVLHSLVIIVSFDMALFVTSGIFRGAFAGFQRFEIINIARLFSLLFKAIVFYIYLSDGGGLIEMAYISIVSNIVIIFFYLWMLKRYYNFVEFSIHDVDKKHIGKVLHYSKFVFIAMIASQLLNYSSSFVIGFYISAAAITWFSIPWSLAEYIKQFCLAMSRTYIPAFSQLESSGKSEEIKQFYISGTRYMLIISNLFCLGMIVLGSDFIAIWMGEAYAEKAVYILYIMFISLYFFSPHLIAYALLQGLSRHKWYAYANLGVSIISLVISILLVQKYGLEGIAAGIAIPQILFCGLAVPIYVSKIVNQSLWYYIRNTHISIFVPSLILLMLLMTLKFYWAPDTYLILIGQAAFGALVYLILVYLISLNKQEKVLFVKGYIKLRNTLTGGS